ncbi:MAG TPA: hypothetical protein VGJ15_02235, partial [Pirellulales bacterium]
LSWQHDGNLLATAGEDNSIRLWEMENGKQVKTWNAPAGIQSVQFTHDGQLVACGRDRQVKLWKTDGKQQGKDFPLTDVALHAAATFDSSKIVGGDWAGEVRIWNAADGKQLGSLSPNPPRLEDRLQIATAQVAERNAERTRLAAAAATAKTESTKLAADLAQAKTAIDAATSAQKTGKNELAGLQKQAEQLAADLPGMKTEMANQEAASTALAEAIAKAQQSAEKLPGNADLAEALAKLKASSEGITAEIETLRKSIDDKAHAQTACEKRMGEVQKLLDDSAAGEKMARQQAEALTPAIEKLAAATAAADQACDQATKAAVAAQADVDRWTGEIEFAKSAAK